MRSMLKRMLVSVLFLAFLTACSGAQTRGGIARDPETTREDPEAQIAPPAVRDGFEFTVVRSGREGRESLERAVRLRDMAAKEQSGVSVKYVDAADDAAAQIAAAADYLSGEHGYCAAEGSFSHLAAPLLAKGALCPAEDFGGALGEDSLNASLKTKNGTYFITGPIVPRSLGDVSCIAANLETARRFSVRLPDETTLAGPGGWDALTASASPVPGGVGIYRYGVTDRSVGIAVLGASGVSVTAKNEDEVPLVPALSRETAETLKKAASLFGDGSTAYRPDERMPREEREHAAVATFSDPGVLYLFCKTKDIPELRDKGNDIRILPYPGGASRADSTGGTTAVILKGGDDSGVAAALGTLEELSLRYTLPEAYDAFLSGRTRYDSDSRDAVAGMLSAPVYELALAVAGEDGEQASDMASDAALGDPDALIGWDLKAALIKPGVEKIFAEDP